MVRWKNVLRAKCRFSSQSTRASSASFVNERHVTLRYVSDCVKSNDKMSSALASQPNRKRWQSVDTTMTR